MFTPYIANYGYGWGIRQKSLPDMDKKLTSISHGGGINGFNTLIERLVDERHLIVLLNNTPGANLGQMSDAIVRILYDKPYTLPKRSIAKVVFETMMEKGVTSAIETVQKPQKGSFPNEYIFSARELNIWDIISSPKRKGIKDAIEIFKLNVEEYPNYANVYDSLAEAYMIAGDKKLAIMNYEKSLELDPNNTNAIEKLEALKK